MIIELILNVLNNSQIQFESVQNLLDFLQVTDPIIYEKALNFFSNVKEDITNTHNLLNEFTKEYPADYDIIKTGLTLFIWYMIGSAKKYKETIVFDNLPKRYVLALHKMIKTWKYKKALKPFIEWEVKSIQISHSKKFDKKAEINTTNFENYLSDSEKILEEYENGKVYEFSWKIVSLQTSHGDSLKLRIPVFSKRDRDLVAFPSIDKSTKDYKDFFWENVRVKVRIERDSLYQKPKLHILEIALLQEPFKDIV